MLCINKRLYGSLRSGHALRTGGPCRPNSACRTGGPLKSLHALRPRGSHRSRYALNALHALRPRRSGHNRTWIRRERRRRRHGRYGPGWRKVTAAIVLKTVDDDHPPLIPCRRSPALHSMPRRTRGEGSDCALSVNDGETSCKGGSGMLT